MLNDAYADLAHRLSKRIASYVMLPLPHIDAALKEMERGFDQLGCVGVNMNIICLNRSIAETEFEPIYAEMNRRGAVLFRPPGGTGDLLAVHRSTTTGARRSAPRSRTPPFVLHMIAKQIPHRYPNIQVHRAPSRRSDPDAAAPARSAGQSQSGHPNLAEAPSVTAKKFWYDTV